MSKYNDKNITKQIVDQDSYNKYLELKANPVFSKEKRMIYTSDHELVIDLEAPVPTIDRLVIDLPSDEQDMIRKRKYAYQSLKNRLMALEFKAYGRRLGDLTLQKNNPIVEQLLDERRSEILDYFAQYIEVDDVHRIIQQEWGYQLSISTLKKFKNKFIDKILKLQKKYRDDLDSIRLSHKKSRLEEYQYLYKKKKAQWELTENRYDYRQLLETMKLIKDEVEETKLKVEFEGKMQIEHTLSMHIGIEMLKGMSINDIILARVASKQRINPTYLINSLHSSIYSKFTGFEDPGGDVNKQQVEYPSAVVYQWNEVEKLYTAKLEEQMNEKELPNVEEYSEDADKLKLLLMKKIQEKKDNINNSLNNQVKDLK